MNKDTNGYEVKSAEYWSSDFVEWKEKNIKHSLKMRKEKHGYEVLNGSGVICGELIGGCIDVFPMIVGTEIWPKAEEWKNKILLVETSEEKPKPDLLLYYLRNLGSQGILQLIKGIIVGKPLDETYYEEYKNVYQKIIKEFNCEDLGIIYNVNIGHACRTGVLPLGIEYEIDLDKNIIKFNESGANVSN